MSTSYARSAAVALLFGAALSASSPMHAQAPLEGKTVEQVYKNIQVLNGTPASELLPAMHLISVSLGVTCEYCHELRKEYEDTKEPKERARAMMKMLADINKNNFGGAQLMTCYTCHRGSTKPVTMVTLPLPAAKMAEAPPLLPSVDDILAKYVQALGGEQAIRKVTTRVITARGSVPTGPGGTIPVPAEVEQYQKAPNLMVDIYRTKAFTVSDGFDGTTKWNQDMQGRVIDALRIDENRAKRDDDLYESLDLKREYKSLAVSGVEKVNDRDAYLIVGYPEGDTPERLYFDIQTGLLIRKMTLLPTPAGNSPFLVDYGDYRDTGSGVKAPFLIQRTPANPRTELSTSMTLRIEKIQDNVLVDDSKFVKPQPQPASKPPQ
jgi:hypothetical protein